MLKAFPAFSAKRRNRPKIIYTLNRAEIAFLQDFLPSKSYLYFRIAFALPIGNFLKHQVFRKI